MNPIRRLFDAVVGLLPVPRAMDDTPPMVDPRVDPAALETFGEEQLAQFGPGQGHGPGGAPLPSRYATDAARDAREAERRVAETEDS
jgi:hypothetical protein